MDVILGGVSTIIDFVDTMSSNTNIQHSFGRYENIRLMERERGKNEMCDCL